MNSGKKRVLVLFTVVLLLTSSMFAKMFSVQKTSEINVPGYEWVWDYKTKVYHSDFYPYIYFVDIDTEYFTENQETMEKKIKKVCKQANKHLKKQDDYITTFKDKAGMVTVTVVCDKINERNEVINKSKKKTFSLWFWKM